MRLECCLQEGHQAWWQQGRLGGTSLSLSHTTPPSPFPRVWVPSLHPLKGEQGKAFPVTECPFPVPTPRGHQFPPHLCLPAGI